MASVPRVGDPAPDFTLEGTDGTFRLGHRHVHALGLDFLTADDLRDALDALPAGT